MTADHGRFSRLEFAQQGRRLDADAIQGQQAVGTPIRTAEQDLALAVESYHCGKFEAALQMYTRALRGNRALVAAWVGQVQMLVELDEYAEARLWSDKALEIFRGNGDLLSAKARACLRAGDERAALGCSDESLRSPGTSPLRWTARGEVQLRRASARARDCFERAIAEPAAGWFDRVIIARIYLHHARGSPALEYARGAVGAEPGHWYNWFVLGECQSAVGLLGDAETSFEHAVQLPGEHACAAEALRELRAEGAPGRLRRWLRGVLRR